jgi:3'(2'), 5'-bisphosphate nucleotidase
VIKLNKRLEMAIKAGYESGKAVLDIYNKDFKVYSKEDLSPLTEADLKAEEIIINMIKENFPHDLILSEESVNEIDRSEGYVWIIDPIDGTKEFVKKNGEFTINIGLIKDGIPVMGVIYAPCFDIMYYGEKGNGAYKIESGITDEITVSLRRENLIAFISRSHGSGPYMELLESPKVGKTIGMGSSLKGCKIADGTGDIYYRFGNTMIWDTCAMETIIREAGGLIKTFEDKDIDYTRKDLFNYGFYILNSSDIDLRRD